MKKNELNKLYWLNKENDDIINRIKELKSSLGLGSSIISGMPSSHKISNPTEEINQKINELEKTLKENQLLIIEEKKTIENFIRNIEEPQMRLIIRLRNIDLLSWNDIAKKLSKKNKKIDRTTLSKKYKNFMKKLENELREQ